MHSLNKQFFSAYTTPSFVLGMWHPEENKTEKVLVLMDFKLWWEDKQWAIIEIMKTQEENGKWKVEGAMTIAVGWYYVSEIGPHAESPGKASARWYLKRKW